MSIIVCVLLLLVLVVVIFVLPEPHIKLPETQICEIDLYKFIYLGNYRTEYYCYNA